MPQSERLNSAFKACIKATMSYCTASNGRLLHVYFGKTQVSTTIEGHQQEPQHVAVIGGDHGLREAAGTDRRGEIECSAFAKRVKVDIDFLCATALRLQGSASKD